MISRRGFFASLAVATLARPSHALDRFVAGTNLPPMTVYKSPSCGCCTKWVDHVRAAGFTVTVHDTDDVNEVKKTMGVPASLASCHTALVAGYVIEGHVPADLVKKIATEKPAKIRGLAVGGMPQGSPGMETGHKEPYDVMAFDRAGQSRVYARR